MTNFPHAVPRTTGARSIADRLAEPDYIPGGLGRSMRDDALKSDDQLEVCGRTKPDGTECRMIGKGVGIRRHRAHHDA